MLDTTKPPRAPSLKRDAAWTAADTFVSAGLAFLFRILAARLLVPEEFGVFALALTTFAVVQVINEFGMAAALIQRPADRFDDDLVDTAYTASTVVSAALFVVNLLVIAPGAAWLYDSPRVGWVTAAVGLSFLFTPSVSIARALLIRGRDYRAITTARIGSTLLSLVVAGLALWLFRNVWALVAQAVSAQVFLAIGMRGLGDWRPRLRFSRATFRETVGYSGLVFAIDTFSAVAKNLDVIVLGRMLSQGEVGLYSFAFYITDVVRLNLASILNRVMFTQYASVQHDMAAVRFHVVRTMSWNALIMLPVMLTVALAGPILLPVLLGDAWRSMGAPLQLLAVSVMLGALGGTTSTVFKALGRPGVELAIAVSTSVLLLLPALIVGVRAAGITGAAAAVAFKVLVSVIVRQVAVDRLVGSTLPGVLKATVGSVLAQAPILLAWALGMAFLPLPVHIRAVVSIALGLAAYAATLLMLRRVDSDAWPAFDDRRAPPRKPETAKEVDA